jgi:hypothetical protein
MLDPGVCGVGVKDIEHGAGVATLVESSLFLEDVVLQTHGVSLVGVPGVSMCVGRDVDIVEGVRGAGEVEIDFEV